MGAKYTTQSISGYNASPPPDDGSQAASNLITWAAQKTKLADPIKTLSEAVNTALVAAFNYSVRQVTASDSLVAGDHMRTVEVAPTVSSTVAVTLTLPDAATMTNIYRVFIKNSREAGVVTIARATGADTIDGTAGNVSLPAGAGIILQTTTGADGYITLATVNWSPKAHTFTNGATVTAGGLTVTAGNITVNGGTVAAPSIWFATGTSASGFYSPGVNLLGCSINGTEAWRTTAGGYFKASNSGTYSGATGAYHEFRTDATDNPILNLANSAASPYGFTMNYTTADPNGTANWFHKMIGNGTERITLRSNGGIANFSANNVNLSTRGVKNNLRIYTDIELLRYEAFLEAVDWGAWKYNDQTHDDWNHGPTVEGVQAAARKYALVDEERSLIAEFSEGKLGLITEDLKNIALASLVGSNKRLRRMGQDHEARLKALEARP